MEKSGFWLPFYVRVLTGLVFGIVVAGFAYTQWGSFPPLLFYGYCIALFAAGIAELFRSILRGPHGRTYKTGQKLLLFVLWGLLVTAVPVEYVFLPASSSPVIGAGLLLVFLGIALRLISINIPAAYFSGNIGMDQAHDLLTSGPYRVIRHPNFLGALLLAWGLPLLLNSWFSLLLSLAITTLTVRRIREEEWFMARTLPDYQTYMKITSRLIPGIW